MKVFLKKSTETTLLIATQLEQNKDNILFAYQYGKLVTIHSNFANLNFLVCIEIIRQICTVRLCYSSSLLCCKFIIRLTIFLVVLFDTAGYYKHDS